MAKISELPRATGMNGQELFPVVIVNDDGTKQNMVMSAEDLAFALRTLEQLVTTDVVDSMIQQVINENGYVTLGDLVVQLASKAEAIHEHMEYSQSGHTHSVSDIVDMPSMSDYATGQQLTDIANVVGQMDAEVKTNTLNIQTVLAYLDSIVVGGEGSETESGHTHSNFSVLETITLSKIIEWDSKSNFSGNYNDLTNKPSLFSGNYNDLTNKPTIPTNILDLQNDLFITPNNFDGLTSGHKLINAINYATQNNCKEVFIPSGTYVMPQAIVLPQNFQHVSLRGENGKTTVLDFKNISGACIKVKGGSGNFSHGVISNLTIKGNSSTTTGTQLCDVNGFYIDNCRFENHLTGVEFYNEDGFTEYCIVKYSDFTSSCQNAVRFSVKDGNGHVSMHGSGLDHATINQSDSSTQSPIIIGSRALLYNSPLSFSIWTRSSIPVIQHNGDTSSYTYGQICNETFGTNTVELCSGSKLYHMGNVSSWGKQLQFGKLVLIDKIKLSDGTPQYNRKPYVEFHGNIINTITHIANCQEDSLLNIIVHGDYYRYQTTLLIGKNIQEDSLTITKLQEHSLFDQLGIGHVTFDTHQTSVRLIFQTLPNNAHCHVSATPLHVAF